MGGKPVFCLMLGILGSWLHLWTKSPIEKIHFIPGKAVDVVRLHFNAKTMAQQYQALYEFIARS